MIIVFVECPIFGFMWGGVDIGYYDTLDMERVVVVVLEFVILSPRVPFL